MARLLLLLCLTSLALVTLAQQTPPQYNSQRYENVDSDSLVKNDRILLNYYKCIMDQGPCNRDGKLFKRVLPEALRTNCAFCTTSQTNLVRKMLASIRTKSEPRFEDLINKFDGNGKYRDQYMKFIFGSNPPPSIAKATDKE